MRMSGLLLRERFHVGLIALLLSGVVARDHARNVLAINGPLEGLTSPLLLRRRNVLLLWLIIHCGGRIAGVVGAIRRRTIAQERLIARLYGGLLSGHRGRLLGRFGRRIGSRTERCSHLLLERVLRGGGRGCSSSH